MRSLNFASFFDVTMLSHNEICFDTKASGRTIFKSNESYRSNLEEYPYLIPWILVSYIFGSHEHKKLCSVKRVLPKQVHSKHKDLWKGLEYFYARIHSGACFVFHVSNDVKSADIFSNIWVWQKNNFFCQTIVYQTATIICCSRPLHDFKEIWETKPDSNLYTVL